MQIKSQEILWDEFQKELKENDSKVEKEKLTKSIKDRSNDFIKFVKENKCKIVGGKNEKK